MVKVGLVTRPRQPRPAGKPAGEGGLSHAELAGVGDDGPARQFAGDLLAELLGLLLTV